MMKPNMFEMIELFKEKYKLPIPNKTLAEIASDIDFEFAFNNAKSYIQKNVRNVMRRTMQSTYTPLCNTVTLLTKNTATQCLLLLPYWHCVARNIKGNECGRRQPPALWRIVLPTPPRNV